MTDIDALLEALSTEEKALLSAGEDMMSVPAVDRLGIPKIRVTDGPNGARGPSYPALGSGASTCLPCGSALGATWDTALVERLGELLGREARDRGCRGLLAPTVNLHRSPLAGRNFECFSEDPLLSGRLAAAYVRGVQSQGVFATVKHFVGNEAEYERGSISSVIDERTLRELYLVPFELAVREGDALGVMTAYNRLNHRWVTEQWGLLTEILRDEWGFRGIVMTDWFGVVDTTASLRAGLDLEMPGPGRGFGPSLAVRAEHDAVFREDLDRVTAHFLQAMDAIGALDEPTPPVAPRPPSVEDRTLIREAAAAATVLLANDGVLPLRSSALRRVAVVGDHGRRARIQGGGSAQVVPHSLGSPLDELVRALGGGVEVKFARGCEVDRSATVVGRTVLRAPAGFDVEVYEGLDWAGAPIDNRRLDDLRLFVLDGDDLGYPRAGWSARVAGTVVPEESGRFELALTQSGRARLLVGDEVVLDGVTDPPPPGGGDFFGFASRELVADVDLRAGDEYEFVLEYARAETTVAGAKVGFRTHDEDRLMVRAVETAAQADVALVFVGTTEEWETEGRDRAFLRLPRRQDELVHRVAAVNGRTVVVVNAGAPVEMSWADEVAAVVQCWFGGEGMAAAIADVLIGISEPGGRLPTTIPVQLAHSPSHDNFPGENGELRYGEGLFMGYRGFEHREIAPRFAFGHGLGYTTFEFGEPRLSSDIFRRGGSLTVSVPLRNTGLRAGTEVVQCYVAPLEPRLARPPKELKAFSKVTLGAGESTVVTLELDDRSFAYFDPGQTDWEEVSARFVRRDTHSVVQERRSAGWQVDPGAYQIVVGRSAAHIVARLDLVVVDPSGDAEPAKRSVPS